ncbi:CcdB family protein [Dankookia sp. GCM10030260]|uniref:CcdB family protein n=1 Tax=Dankookia sp. GCM10030260 TaxID=3273390 RepID=UPI00360C08DE
MPHCDDYPGGASATCLLNVQPDQLDRLPMRGVVPLAVPAAALPELRDLTQMLVVEGQDLVLLTPLLAAAPRKRPGKPRARADEITRALDLLPTGCRGDARLPAAAGPAPADCVHERRRLR